MNVLMILENEFPFDERVEKEALSLISSGCKVYLACSTLCDRAPLEDYKGIQIIRKKSSIFQYKKARIACLTTPFYFNFWTKFITQILRNNDIDVIHVHDLPLAKVGIDLSKSFNKSLVVDFHENYPDMLKEEEYTQTFLGRIISPISLWRKYEKNVLKKISNAIVVCDEMKGRINKIAGVDNVAVLENVIDINRWPEYVVKPKSTTTVRLLYVGGMTSKRGLEVAIKGVAIFNKSSKIKAEFDLYGAGKDWYLKSLTDLAKEYNVDDSVKLKGYIKLPKDAQQLASYTIGVIPHLRSVQTDNSSPNKLYQYLNYKLPVLCSDCDSLVRVVSDIQGGVIYKNESPEDFSEKLSFLIEGGRLEKLGEIGHKGILEKYNWESASQNLLSLYAKF